MTVEERDLERVDALLRAQARAPAPALAPAVLASLRERRRPRTALLRPLAFATAAAVLLLGAGLGIGLKLGGSPEAALAAGAPRTVHFALTAPGAKTVVLVGDFNGWSPEQALPLAPAGDGRFIASVDLPAGRYAYAFVVDGERVVPDPRASAFEPDGFGGTNSVLEL